MKELLKQILKTVNLYHPFQLYYRGLIGKFELAALRRKYRKFEGEGFQCNVCGKEYSRFAPRYPSKENEGAISKYEVVAGYGENMICPNCYSSARERLLVGMLSQIDIHGKRVLHLSPEKNVFNYISSKAKVETGDLFPGFYKNIDQNIRKMNVLALPYPDETFDMVIANHIMEHIPDDRKAMSEIYRVLMKNGQAIMQVPFSTITETIEEPGLKDPAKRSELFGQKDHVRIYGLHDYIKRLQDSGFTVEYVLPSTLRKLQVHAIQPHEGFFLIMKF